MISESWVLLLVVGIASALGPPPHRMDEGSLRSALNAVTRKQRSLESSPDEYYNDLHSFKYYGGRDRERDEDLEFLPFENGQLETIGDGFQKTMPNGHWADEKPEAAFNAKLFDRMLLDYLGSEANQGDAAPSAFRERERIGGQKRGGNSVRSNINDKQLAKLFLEELQDGQAPNQAEDEEEDDLENFRIWYEKHRVEPEGKSQGYDLFNAPMSWGNTFAKQNVKDLDRDLLYVLPAERRNVNGRYPLGREYKEYRELRKRYPVAKRSPKPIQQKRQVTDPKVAQDLGNLFGKKPTDHHDHDHTHDHDHDHDHDHSHSHDHNHDHTSETPNTTTRPRDEDEKVTQENKPREHPIEIKKKSVDWSQYFGIDKRKKKASLLARPGTQDQDDEWLLQQYYKTMAENLKPSERVSSKESEKRNMLQQIDSRLKSLEDLIIEEPLKYTKSRDSTDIQKVKDNIMARAAASYSLEKMRRALSEFQNNVAMERQAQKLITPQNNPTTDQPDNEDKRSGNSVNGDEGNEDDGSCPEIELVERRCRAVDMWIGNRAQVFYPLCIMHQVCRACVQEERDDKSCDKLFTSASRACEGHVSCIKAARMAHATLSQLQPLVGTPGLCLCELQAQMRK